MVVTGGAVDPDRPLGTLIRDPMHRGAACQQLLLRLLPTTRNLTQQ